MKYMLWLLPLWLPSCAIADHYIDQGNLDKTRAAYQKCIVDNVSNPSICEPLRQLYVTDRASMR